MKELRDDWEFNVLDVYNFRQDGPLRGYFQFIEENHAVIDGDICEIGVFRGRSLLATALFLHQLGSPKMVYGFDSFAGFPEIDDPRDDPGFFQIIFEAGQISKAL
jgi:hypothetical protein